MKTLVIHPVDPSTTFLDIVYKNIPKDELTLIQSGTKQQVRELIESHDRVMMMGHGSPNGLFAVGQFKDVNSFSGYVIDQSMVELLEQKDNSVFIWCNADQFVNRFDLKGFYTKMFISEVGEATYCGLPGMDQETVDESNYGFVNMLSECVSEPQEMMYQKITKSYGELAENNPVALYNWNRLCFNKP
jgi:hypothetical protein